MYVAGGPTGQRISELLESEKVNIIPVPEEGWSREDLTVLDDTTGKQYRFTFPGLPLPNPDLDKLILTFENLNPAPESVVLSGSIPPDFIHDLKKTCDRKGSKLVVDTSGQFLETAANSGIWLMKPNYGELCDHAGLDRTDLQNVEMTEM